jgi:heme-degrading monooxygenase HmoA
MFSVIFEVLPGEGKMDNYLELAKHLKPRLEAVDGFVDNERFGSLRRPGWLLSHSGWRDEKAVVRWRTEGEHHKVQGQGRVHIFDDYHLRVGDVMFDSTPSKEGPVLERRFDETEVGEAKVVTFTEVTPVKGNSLEDKVEQLAAALGLDIKGNAIAEYDAWASIYNPGKLALLVSWRNGDAAARWSPVKAEGIEKLRNRRVRVIRDYGRFDRREAPQYYADVRGRETLHPAPKPVSE